jgi:hypothetical protein
MRPTRLEWTPELIAKIGTMSDAKLARELGIKPGTVTHRRRLLGIEPFRRQRAARKWSSADIALLGKMSDREVAEITGRSIAAVYTARRERGIAGAEQTRWLPKHLDMLGKAPDGEIAELVGCSLATVFQKRCELGIAPYKRHKPRNPVGNRWTEFGALPQHEFIAGIQRILSEHWGRKAVYQDIATITLYSLSRIQKWATSGSAQEPMAITVRHHIWAATMLALSDVIKEPRKAKAPH